MGAVFSIVKSPLHLSQSILTLGVAASASAFQPFNPEYYSALLHVFPSCAPAEIEPFEDFSDVLEDLCDEGSSEDLITCAPLLHTCYRSESHTRPQCLEQPAVWRSQTVEAKKLYLVAAKQATRKAIRFQRRYNLYGPPDWTDPALFILPPACLLPGNFSLNVLSSVFPFAAPHVVISPPRYNYMDPIIAWSNGVQCQNQAFGNQLIIAKAPSLNGPGPLVVNPAPYRPLPVAPIATLPSCESTSDRGVSDDLGSDDGCSDVPSLAEDSDDTSSCVPSACSTVEDGTDDLSLLSSSLVEELSLRDVVRTRKVTPFWIEEDDEDLPDLSESW